MRIKPTTDYAFRILTYLALKSNVTNSREIANLLDIPQKNVLSIGRKLKAAKYVNIISGPYGGYIIAKKPEDVFLYDIVSMFEGIEINCHSGQKGSCIEVDNAVNSIYSDLQNVIGESLKSKTLADFVEKCN